LARDRQRAKQRRRRQSGGTGPTGPARTRPPREAPIEEPTDTVFPTRGAVGPVEEEVDFDETVDLDEAEEEAAASAPDQLDPAVTEERDLERHPRRSRGRIITFLGHVIDELRRVQWPDRRHVAQGTAVVLGFVVIAGTFLGLMDALWKPLVEAIL
jgi:preprotein translocase SecE subunit